MTKQEVIKSIIQLFVIAVIGAIAIYHKGYLFLLVGAVSLLVFALGKKRQAGEASFSGIGMSLVLAALLIFVILSSLPGLYLIDSLIGADSPPLWWDVFAKGGNLLFGVPEAPELFNVNPDSLLQP